MFRHSAIMLLLLAMMANAEIAGGAEEWRTEFEDVCGRTSEAAILPLIELQALIAKGERVRKVLESERKSVRIVFQKRVQKCLDLYRTIADSMPPEGKTPPPAQ